MTVGARGRARIATVLALALAGCGASEESPRPTPSATATAASGDPAQDTERDVLERLPPVPEATGSMRPPTSADSDRSAFLRAVFDDAEALWSREFAAAGLEYQPARITIFRDEVDTACGAQSASVGPFYCPADQGVYLDTRFFDALSRQVGVRIGDVAQAYVVAHEVGHHVQFLLRITHSVRAADEQDPAGENARSVRLELQADCFAGIWKHSRYTRGQLTAADMAEALNAAAAIGDDFQQLRATGTVRPEDWTHGSAAQRQHWLRTGFEQGTPASCDTFAR